MGLEAVISTIQPHYNVSRPFPYRWFLPLAVVVAAAAIAIFSWLNYISSAYTLGVLSTVDPNATISSFDWLHRWPSYFVGEIQPQCQPQVFQVNSEFFTNQTALMYTITDIWNATDPNNLVRTPTLIYQNQPLESCAVDTIQVDFEAEDRTAAQYSWAMWGETVTAFVSCVIQNNGTVWMFNMTSQYDFVPPTAGMPIGDSFEPNVTAAFLTTDPQNKASLWWGESLLATYWTYLAWQMEHIRENGNNTVSNLRKGTIYLRRHNLQDPVTDITDPDFWDVDYRFISNEINDEGMILPDKKLMADWMPYKNLTLSELIERKMQPNVWSTTDALAKSYYSSILTDLGQTTISPNILLNATALGIFTANLSDMHQHVDNAHPGPAKKSYDNDDNQAGPLGTTPSVISTTYTCQVPVQRSTGSIVMAVFLADLVFVQAVWKLLTFVTSTWLHHTHPNANTCEGCGTNPEMVPAQRVRDPQVTHKPILIHRNDPNLTDGSSSGHQTPRNG